MTRSEILQTAKPILFNTEMVRAILEGRKTVTRRVIKHDIDAILSSPYHQEHPETPDKILIEKLCLPPYKKEDILYVRETWNYGYIETSDIPEKIDMWFEQTNPNDNCGEYIKTLCGYFYKADEDAPGRDIGMIWRPSIHMPKEAARIFLRVTDVRVERLQEITEEQAEKEGMPDSLSYPINPIYCPICHGNGIVGGYNPESLGFEDKECPDCNTSVKRFRNLWNSTIKKNDIDRYGWDANPWVWVIEFERVKVD